MSAINFPASPTLGQNHTVNGRTWVWNGSAWDFIGTVGPAGPQGPQGVAGPQGPQGPAGPAGATGAQGPAGPTGAAGATGSAGAAASVSVGTTTTGAAGSSASVTNSGTSSAAVLNFSIPKGDTGATGAAGGIFGGLITLPPVLSNWTQHNISGGSSVADSSVGPVIKDAFTTGARIRGLYKAVPATPYTIDALISARLPAANYSGAGIYFTDGTKVQAFGSSYINGLVNRVMNYSNATTFSAEATTVQSWLFEATLMWHRVVNDGTNISFYHSSDGVNWNLRYSVAKSSGYLGSSGYTKIGFYLCSEAAASMSGTAAITSATLLSWKVS